MKDTKMYGFDTTDSSTCSITIAGKEFREIFNPISTVSCSRGAEQNKNKILGLRF